MRHWKVRNNFLFVALSSFALVSCASLSESVDSLTPTHLNVTKTEYNGKLVKVRGWMRSEFENYALWQDKIANDRGTFFDDCVSLLIPESMDTSRYNKRYVEVEGVFLEKLPRNIVHLGGCNVTYLQLTREAPPILIKWRK